MSLDSRDSLCVARRRFTGVWEVCPVRQFLFIHVLMVSKMKDTKSSASRDRAAAGYPVLGGLPHVRDEEVKELTTAEKATHYMRCPRALARRAGGWCCNTMLLSSGLPHGCSACSVAEGVVMRSSSRLCCKWPKGILHLIVHVAGSAHPLPSPCLPSRLALPVLSL